MQWEYLIVYLNATTDRQNTEATLDNYGLDRWELAAVVYNDFNNQIQCFFKRELLERIA